MTHSRIDNLLVSGSLHEYLRPQSTAGTGLELTEPWQSSPFSRFGTHNRTLLIKRQIPLDRFDPSAARQALSIEAASHAHGFAQPHVQ